MFLFTCVVGYAQQNSLIHFNSNSNLSESFIYSIIQDSSGYLWVSTSNGIFRYNGFNFNYFSHDELVNDNFITTSCLHGKDVWLGHRTGGITAIVDGEFLPYTINDTLLSSIVAFALDKNNELWAASYSDGLFNLSDPLKPKHYQFDIEYFTVQDFCFVDKNTLLVGADDGVYLCSILKDEKIHIKKQINDIPSVRIPSILKLSEEDFIVATEDNGIYWLIMSGRAEMVSNLVTTDKLRNNLVTNLLMDSQWNLWIGTMGGGLLKLSGVFTKRDSDFKAEWFVDESLMHVSYLYEDRDENIWVGGYGTGLSKISCNPFEWNSISYPGNKESVSALTFGLASKWIATETQLICLNKANEVEQSYLTHKLLKGGTVTDIHLATEDALWIATSEKGIYKLDLTTKIIKHVKISDGILENKITDLESTNGYLWVGTRKGLACVNLINNEVKWYTINQGSLPHNVINDIYPDEHGNVWISTPSGVNCYKGDGGFSKMDILKYDNIVVNSMIRDQNGALWLATNGNGVIKIENDSSFCLQEAQGLFSNFCYGLVSDKNGYIWVLHKEGISRIHEEVLAIKSIYHYAGFKKNDILKKNACLLDNQGFIWFGSNRGVLSYNSDWENVKLYPPIINLLSLKINGLNADIHKKLKLKPGTYNLDFEFIGINLKEPEKVKYQYRLKGYNNDWSDITEKNKAVFNGVGSGKYILELNASSGDGVTTSSPFRFQFLVKKPFLLYWWLYPLLLLFFVVLFYAFIKRREYVLIKDNLRLEQGVKERTLEIERQKDEIARQRDLIKIKNRDITDSIKYARSIQSAIFPSEDILIEALPQHFLINKPKDIVSGDFCWYTKVKNKYVIAVTDCTGHGVPGSIMSMLAITLFNEVVNNLEIIDTGEILEMMRIKVISALNQHHKQSPSQDGMNVGLVVLDPNKNFIQFSGAFHNLIHINDNGLNIIRAERTPIGYTPLIMPAFATHDINYQSGDMFYLFSDGYQDQFGGEKDKKFSNKRLLTLLNEINLRSVQEQKLIMEMELKHWMQGYEQTDDIILLGFKM